VFKEIAAIPAQQGDPKRIVGVYRICPSNNKSAGPYHTLEIHAWPCEHLRMLSVFLAQAEQAESRIGDLSLRRLRMAHYEHARNEYKNRSGEGS
jgi:hypothetical protein